MSGKRIALCSLTNLMFADRKCASGGFIDSSEPLASIVLRYKSTIQKLQLEILDVDPYKLEGICRSFEKLEISIDRLIEYSVENH
jgi:hypothetical protein